MKMINMEMSEESENESYELKEKEGSKYPYGLKLHVDEKSMEKLGIKALPAVGQKMMLMAEVEVCDISQYESVDGGSNRSMGLQIVAMGLDKPKTFEDIAKKMYGEK